MKRFYYSKVVLLGMGLSIASAAQGFVHRKDTSLDKRGNVHLGHRVVRPSLTGQVAASKAGVASFGKQAVVKIDRATKAIRVIVDPDAPALKGSSIADLQQACLNFVGTHQEYFGRVTPKNLHLDKKAVLLSKDMQFLKYRVSHRGIAVEDATVDCRYKFGKLVQVVNMSFSEAAEQTGTQQKGLQTIIKDRFDVDIAQNQGQVYRVVADKTGYKLVLTDVFRINKAGEPFAVQVETNTGKIFEQRPLHHYVDGKAEAQIFDRWWQEDLIDVGVGNVTIETTAGNVTTDATGRFTAQADSAPKLNGFAGTRVDVRAVTGDLSVVDSIMESDMYAIQQVRETTGETFEGKQTSQAMVFHHTNQIIERAKLYLNNDWFETPLVANANLNAVCNAHWDGTTINFYSAGSECANTGLISDVVYHEWGHGLDANTGGIEDGGYSEGYGDIMSLVFTHSPILGIGFRTDGSEVRDLEPDRVYPDDANGEVHAEGLIIGSTFYDLYLALVAEHGEAIADELLARYAFNMIVTASRYTDVYDALKVIDDNDGVLTNGTPNLCLINEVFGAHGLAEPEAACLLGEMDASINDVAGNGNGEIDPGEQFDVNVSILNTTGTAITNVAGTASLGVAVDGIAVTQSTLSFGDIAAGEVAESTTPVTIDVADTVACGTAFDVLYEMTSTEREAKFKTTYHVGRKLVGDADLKAATDLPLPITDLSTTTTTLVFDGSDWTPQSPVHAARLKFDITHTYRGDLEVRLISPSGQSYVVHQGNDSQADIHFDQDITAIIGGALGQGEWRFEVEDGYDADEGTLDAVELTLTPAKFVCEM